MEGGDIQVMEAADFHARAGECSTEDFKSVKDEFVSPEQSLEEKAPEEEVEESASMQQLRVEQQQQQLLREFDAVHDEAQQLRIMNLLLQSRVRRFLHQRNKAKRALSSAFFPTASQASELVGDAAVTPERLEEELKKAGEVRRQLQAEAQRGAEEKDLLQRLATARQQVADRAAQLQQLQDKLLTRLRAPPALRQGAERLLKRVWPQMQQLRKERLLHSRAAHELESARRQVAELDGEALGPQRSVAEYEEMLVDAARLAQHDQKRSEQLAALRSAADRNLQEAAHLHEALRGTQREILLARLRGDGANAVLRAARQQVGKIHKERNELCKEKNKLNRKMELLAHPELLRDHEAVRQRLRATQAELQRLRVTYAAQEQHIAAVRGLTLQRERSLRECRVAAKRAH